MPLQKVVSADFRIIDFYEYAGGNLSSEHGEPGTHSQEVAEGWREAGHLLAGAALPVEGAT